MRLLPRKGYLIEERGMTTLAETDPEAAVGPLQSAACTYRIALGPRAGQKVLSLQTVLGQAMPPTQQRCVNAQGFSLHAEVCCAAHQHKKLESQGQGRVPERQRGCVRTPAKQAGSWPDPKGALLGAPRTQHLCRYITRPAIANDRLLLQLKNPYHDGTTHIVMSPLEFMQRLPALVPRPRPPAIVSKLSTSKIQCVAGSHGVLLFN